MLRGWFSNVGALVVYTKFDYVGIYVCVYARQATVGNAQNAGIFRPLFIDILFFISTCMYFYCRIYFPIIKYDSTYVIVGIGQKLYGFPKFFTLKSTLQ